MEVGKRASEIKGALLITVSTGVTGPREASAFLRRPVKCPWYSAPGNIFRLRLSKNLALTFHLTKASAPPVRCCLALAKSDKTTARHATFKIAISRLAKRTRYPLAENFLLGKKIANLNLLP